MANQFEASYANVLPTTATALATGTTTGGWVLGTITMVNKVNALVTYTLYLYNGSANIYLSPGNAQVQALGMTVIQIPKLAINNSWILYGLAGTGSALHTTVSVNIVSP